MPSASRMSFGKLSYVKPISTALAPSHSSWLKNACALGVSRPFALPQRSAAMGNTAGQLGRGLYAVCYQSNTLSSGENVLPLWLSIVLALQ